ncbi:thymidine kinase [Mycoplasma bradburyae]|uniref:Thymidine kinase n=1 Tax=Mycoplasma bradburyae TaxID=2963128 RepID=A0AAW6HMS1_9MOLU|nr:thymidine kinase [Mycoplasma bradburyae]MDC4163169.1 thymidine kinase [Mycoplasma bradburyae]MDC4181783.1 thymidine kinase [Mycoplasma bradburyae]MDC4182484.1 thymidine kinase [Mycoplasma bradburyae]MDC4183157.1 thymidine kinase [Mycoplasma bradburyae]MDC4183966.1 thymidine kinase [Mycoplasma bradburyae]
MAKKNAMTTLNGWIEAICGPMFAGKTDELIRKIKRYKYADVKSLVFSPTIDTRSYDHIINSRDGREIECIKINKPFEIYDYVLMHKPQLIGIDEAQFFDDSLVEVIQTLADNQINVIVAGLDRDFRGEPFEPIPTILGIAESIIRLTAICSECGAEASRTQRLINNDPADYHCETILIGDKESYAPRCRHHHKVPNRPINDRTKDFKRQIKNNFGKILEQSSKD